VPPELSPLPASGHDNRFWIAPVASAKVLNGWALARRAGETPQRTRLWAQANPLGPEAGPEMAEPHRQKDAWVMLTTSDARVLVALSEDGDWFETLD